MLFLYDKQKKVLQPCKETRFSDHGLLERQNIERWVEEFPQILGEELLVITTEYDRFDNTAERVDLLALDKEGNLVVVELKRDDSGKNVDLQAIKYAAYCSTLSLQDIVEIYQEAREGKGGKLSQEAARDAILQFIESDDFEELNERPRIILVAREFRPEVTASVLWLNKCGLDITCVKLSPYALNDSGIAVESGVFIPLPVPEEMEIQRKSGVSGQTARTVTQIEYIDFFQDVIKRLKRRLPREYSQPKGRCYYVIPTGMSRVILSGPSTDARGRGSAWNCTLRPPIRSRIAPSLTDSSSSRGRSKRTSRPSLYLRENGAGGNAGHGCMSKSLKAICQKS